MNRKSRLKRYYIGVYDVYLHVAINYPKNKFFKTYFADRDCTETLESDIDHFQSKGFTWGILSTKKDPRVIFVNLDLTRAEGILDLVDTMNHEAFHAATGILRWADVPMNDSTEEAYAYLVGFISRYIYKTVFEPKHE